MMEKTPISFYLHDDPNLSLAYSPYFTHDYITYFSVQMQEWIMKQSSIYVQPNPNFGDWPTGPEHIDLYMEQPKINRNIALDDAFDCAERNGEYSCQPLLNTEIDPWKILLFYCCEPDLELDCGLNLHWTQKIFKGSHGYRHMTIPLFGIQIGKVIETFKYHYNASLNAWKQNNSYWAWRFLARATHYLADIGHPFHVKSFPNRQLFSIFTKPKKFFKTIAALHNAHEVYVTYRLHHSYQPFKEALCQGALEGSRTSTSIWKEIPHYQKIAMKSLSPLYLALQKYYGDELINIYQLDSSTGEDISKQTTNCEEKAQAFLFRDLTNPAIKIMDDITTKLLFNVGRMEGMLFSSIRTEFEKKNQK